MKQPNIIFFNPDSYRGDVLGHLGNPAAVTPNLDAIVADDAVSYRHAFSQNPVCTPSQYPYTQLRRCRIFEARALYQAHAALHHPFYIVDSGNRRVLPRSVKIA